MSDISEGWAFWLGEESRGTVDLPHCWNTTDTFQVGVEYHRGTGRYTKTIQGNAKPWLISEGFYGTGTVTLNGKTVCDFDAQYLGLELQLPLEAGENELCIELSNRCKRHVLPGIAMPDFLLYGGLAGRVRLAEHPPDLPDIRVGLDAEGQGTVRVNRSARVRDPEGVEVANGEGTLIVEKPQRWSPDHPVLYEIACGETIRRIGFREARFTNEGFFLNGARLALHGLNRHEAMPGFGNALSPEQHRADAEQLKELGCNLVRLSHYPQHPAFLDACDELGILVAPEIATWKSVRGGRWLKNAQRQLRDLIQRDRHRPSVILWGLGNESRARRPYLALRESARELDPERPTLYAENHLHRALRKKTADLCEIYGMNYEFEKLEEAHRAGQGPVLITEGASHWAEPGDWEAEEEQLRKMRVLFQAAERHAFTAGFTMWCFADYATLRKQRYTRYSGIVGAWRTPKAGYWYFKAMYAEKPFAKIMARWGEKGGKGARAVRVFTNGPSAVVKRNNITVWKGEGRGYHAFELDFEPGALWVESGGAVHEIHSWKEPAWIGAQFGRPGAVELGIFDASNARVGDWNGRIRVRAQGEVHPAFYTPEPVVEIRNGQGHCHFHATDHGELNFEADKLQSGRYVVVPGKWK